MPTYQAGVPQASSVEDGRYVLEVIEANDKLSKAGNDMIELKLREVGSNVHIYEYLVFKENAFWKIDQFRAATGDEIKEGEAVEIIAEDLIGRFGLADLITEEGTNGKPRNKVAGWVLPSEADDDDTAALNRARGVAKSSPSARKPAPAAAAPEEDDDIPF